MYWTFVRNAMRIRARRLLLAFSALTVAAALATALFSVYSDVERRVRAEFASYGPNLLVTSPSGVPLSAVTAARQLGAVAAPFLFFSGRISGQPVALAGVDENAARELTQYWHVVGSREGCIAGINIAQKFGLRVGANAGLEGEPCLITGIVSTGATEDNELILPFADAVRLSGIENAATVVQVRAPGEKLEAVRAGLQRAFPAVNIRIVEAVANTETSVVRKIRFALLLLLALILIITTMSVTSNFSELVMERGREIGILKAIGAAERKIALLFVTESILLASSSALVGYLAGLILAGWIGRSVFAAPFRIHLDLPVFLIASSITLAVALAATGLAAGSIWRIQPARILRGE